jgi:hypothetical protein
MAGFQVILDGRIWVITEGLSLPQSFLQLRAPLS